MVQALARGCQCGSSNLRVTGGTGFNMVSLEVEAAPATDKEKENEE